MKKHPLLRLAAASLVLLSGALPLRADYSSTVAGFGPLAYWRFNETVASPPINSVTNLGSVGSIGNGYIVMDVDKGQPGALGALGNSIRLNNPGATIGNCGSKVDVPYTAALNPTAPFSVEFWAKPNAMGSDSGGITLCPISCFNPNFFGGGNRSGWLFYINQAGVWQWRLGLTSGYAGICTSTGGNATVGTWQHIVGTWDGTIMRLYANGVLIGSLTPAASAAAAWLPNTQMALRIGGTPLVGNLTTGYDVPWDISNSGLSGNRGWDGWMDEVAIYPTVLSASKVAAHYAAAATPGTYGATILADGPLGYWNMNEPAVATPAPSTLPIVANSGSLSGALDGTNLWGVAAAQSGPAYPGLGAGNKACYFNGESGYVGLKDDPAMHFTGNVTLMAWVKPTVKDFFRDIIAHGTDDTSIETFLRISRGIGSGFGDGNYYEVGMSDGANGVIYDSVLFPIPAGDVGNWVFLAGTFDGANWNLYRNGVLVGSTPASEGDTGAIDVTNRWSIGSKSDPLPAEGIFFGGYIDEPAIFNTALSAGNIAAIYDAAQVSPVIYQGLSSAATVFKGSSLALSVTAEGAPTLGYNWYSNGIFLGLPSTTTSVNLNNLQVSSQTWTVNVTNQFGTASTTVSFNVVAAPPAISKNPTPTTRFVGYPFSFSVTAGGSSPLAYYWSNVTAGTLVQAGASASYSGVASLANAGNYSCLVSNEAGTSLSSPAALTVVPIPSGYGGAVIGSGPVAYWRLGESSGTVASDGIGGKDGLYTGGVTLGQPGYSAIDPNTAVAFSGAINSYAGSIDGSAFNFAGTTSSFSIELWANGPEGQGDESTLIAKGIGSTGTTATEQFSIDVSGGKYRFFTRGNNNAFFEADADIGPNGTWQHIVAVYDASVPTAPLMYIYVNGLLPVSGGGAGRPAGVRASTDPVSIGSKRLGNDPAYNGSFLGTIDEVAIYSTALSASTVTAHYAAAYGPALAPVIDLQPKSITNYAGLPVTLSAAAHGTVPLSYQWRKAGVDIGGATASTYTINPLTTGDAGDYSVGITNGINPGVVSAIAHVTVLTAPTSPPAIPGLVTHLPFDGNLTDATGRGNNGVGVHVHVVYGTNVLSSNTVTPTYVAGAVGSQGLHFSTTDASSYGTNFDNFYATLGDRPDFHFSSNVNFSFAFWIKRDDGGFGALWPDIPFLTTTPNSTFGNGLVFAWTFGIAQGTTPAWIGGWAMSIFDTAAVGVGGRGAQGSIDDGNWHHLAHVFDRKLGNLNYLDGVPVAFNKQSGTSATAAQNVDTGQWLTIGQDPTGTYNGNASPLWSGTAAAAMDDLGIWKHALTPLEVASIYIAGVSNNLSFAGAPFVLSSTQSGSNLILSWTVGVLQSASTAGGPYADVVGATSPRTVPLTGGPTFYRIRL